MAHEWCNTYQLAGLDPRERGFNRPVELMRIQHRYRAAWRYEAAHLMTDFTDSEEAALQLLVATLHGQGYRQLKTQASFRHGTYLGSQESWVDYPDPPQVPPKTGLMAVFRRWFHREHLAA
jgi:hypothetical protein